ncbi:RING/FYVE/PHD zinc finger superfamily protein [Prunus dulcis]|uniref:RING/FYVE/PHD zinc finger superfamily protein n=1 Tax=Prunus dulcis TaxID=3755 RepID=A0A4Y1REP1_PRUDU|nr:RING/FYVE/PHD zinc finger superfamily protein [Prunus dulcis]
MLKEYEILRERTARGEPDATQVNTSTGIDPDAVAAIRRQRLSEISLWFTPHNNSNNNNNTSTNSVSISQAVSEQPQNTVVAPAENPATKWAVEGTGILLATGLLTVTLAWLIAPRVGKFVLTRIKYGPARYWAILFVFWFLVFGIWASRTHSSHTT